MRSVVLASYQGEQFIGAQIDSIVTQLSSHDELIVCDDASEDGTLAIVRSRRDPRIKILANANRLGYVKNFERAIQASSGDHVFFSDQDDIWLPNKIAALSSALERKPCAASDAIVVDKDLKELYGSYFKFRNASSFSLSAVFLKPCLIGATMAFRRQFLETLLPFPPGLPHDFWISLNAIWEGNLEVIRDPLILYRRHPLTASVSATRIKRTASSILKERAGLARCVFLHQIPLFKSRAS